MLHRTYLLPLFPLFSQETSTTQIYDEYLNDSVDDMFIQVTVKYVHGFIGFCGFADFTKCSTTILYGRSRFFILEPKEEIINLDPSIQECLDDGKKACKKGKALQEARNPDYSTK